MSWLLGLSSDVWVPSAIALAGTVATSVFALAGTRLSTRTSRTQQALDALVRTIDETQEQRDHEAEFWKTRLAALHEDFARDRERTAAQISGLRNDLKRAHKSLEASTRHIEQCETELVEIRARNVSLSAEVASLRSEVARLTEATRRSS